MKAARIFIHVLLYVACICLLMPAGYAYSHLMITKIYYRVGLSMVVVSPYSWRSMLFVQPDDRPAAYGCRLPTGTPVTCSVH